MAQDMATLFNLALSAVGSRSSVTSEDEQSREAALCRKWFHTVLDQMLCSAFWDCAREVNQLTLDVARTTDAWSVNQPEPPWAFRYHVPSDMLRPRFFSGYESFVMTQSKNVSKILTNTETPILTYTKRQTVTAAWDASLWYAMQFALAGAICLDLTGKPARANMLYQRANMAIMEARADAANRNNFNLDSIPEWLIARGVSAGSSVSQYIYAYGPMFGAGGE